MDYSKLSRGANKAIVSIAHPRHSQEMLNHKYPSIRSFLAAHGTDDHREELLSDQEPLVREHVAGNGNWDHAERLSFDPDDHVKRVARQRFRDLQTQE